MECKKSEEQTNIQKIKYTDLKEISENSTHKNVDKCAMENEEKVDEKLNNLLDFQYFLFSQ